MGGWSGRLPGVGGLRGGITVVANNTDKVNTSATGLFTSRKTSIMVASVGRRGLGRATRTVTGSKKAILPVIRSIASRRS